MNLNEIPIYQAPPFNFGIQIIYSEHCATKEQFRFPRSKKRRIKAKWTLRAENWRLVPRIYRNGNTVYAHPAWKDSLEKLTQSLSQVVGNIAASHPRREIMYFQL